MCFTELLTQSISSGKTCQSWNSNIPHTHNYKPQHYGDYVGPENNCRNPSQDIGGVWCYTTDSEVRWEYCAVPECSEAAGDCQYGNGVHYRGPENTTTSGKPCIIWTDYITPDEVQGIGDHNECRNPTRHANTGVWCYIDSDNYNSKTWEYCPVPQCTKQEVKERYHGTVVCKCKGHDMKEETCQCVNRKGNLGNLHEVCVCSGEEKEEENTVECYKREDKGATYRGTADNIGPRGKKDPSTGGC